MMDILKNLKLNSWYGVLLYLGVLLLASTFYFETDFIEEKHLFGFGIGMILIGIGYLISEKNVHEVAYGGILSYQINKHNFITIILIILGLIIIGVFGYLIIKNLI